MSENLKKLFGYEEFDGIIVIIYVFEEGFVFWF